MGSMSRESVQDATNFEKFLNDLKAQGEIDPQAKSFLRQIEENVYNPNGVTYEQLKNSRQLINAYLRNVKDPSTLGHIQKASANFLKNDIDNAIESLLKQNKSAYEKISELQKSAISDYRGMKQALELVDKAKIRDKHTHESDAINSLMKIIKGQGQKDLTNYQALTKGLNESDKERLELSMLNRLMEQSLKQDESVKVFDSAQFFNKLNEFKDDVFSTPKAKEYIDIASGFHKLFKNDAKIAESLKPATTKNLSQGLATTLSGALKYQWTKFALGTLYRNAPDRILGVKLPKALNEATAGAALKYHIKRALERSHSISDFSKNLELSAQNAKFSNNTLKIIEELNNGVKQASEEIKEATKPSNLVKSIREQDTRPFEVIETKDKEAFLQGIEEKLKDSATPLPKGMSVEEFKQSLESVENKDRFLEHLETRDNSQDRLKFLSLIEPIIREPHIEIFIKDKDGTIKKEYIKAFKDENKTRLYMLITQDNDTILRTFIPKLNERYMRNHVRNADIIHSFIQPNRTAKSDNALSDVVVYGDNNTQKDLIDQEDLLKTQENAQKKQDLNETTQEATKLSPLEQANAEKLAKLQHAITPLKEFGKNYPEFALKPKEALEKLLQEKNGQVAGAAYRDDLGGIDFVWGNKDYGLEHILKRREEQAISKGLSEAEAKEYALNVVKSIPEIIEKGVKVDNNGRIAIEYKHMRVGLNDKWDNQKLENKWVISSYEIYNSESGLPFRPIAQLQEVGLEPSKLTEPNTTTNALKNQDLSPLEQANAEKLLKLQHAITPLKEFGKNYPEFALKPKEALEKLLQEKNGQVAGAAYREDLGGIDFVWGAPKTKDSVGYGLAHILERREQQALSDGLSEAEAKEYALNIVKSIPEVLEKGSKGTDHLGRVFVDYGNIRVGLNNTWNNKDLENHWVISSYELRDTTEKPTHFPTSQAITKEKDIHSLNSVEPNLTTNPQKTTQTPLSPLEQANAEKLLKLESEKLESEKEFTRLKEQETKRKEALKKKLEHERGNAGNIESQTKIQVGEDIPTQALAQIPKSRVRLNEREIYDLDYAIVKAKDLKPSFTTGGTQKRTDMNEEQIKSIAENFDPKKIFGSGGFEDLPIILHDGQVIAGNHRIQGMLNFTPKSRFAYEKAIKEYYHIDLKPDELLVRMPSKRLNNTEINNLAASSNQGRFNSESDHAIAVLSHYEPKLKELETKLNADSIYSLKNIVAKNLNFDKATHPNVGDSNLALLMFNMPRTKTQGIELLNRWQKEFSNDIKSYEKVKKMFVDNAGSFHNLIHDLSFPNVSLNAYLSDIMDRSFANLKNYQSTSESLKDLSEKFYKTSSLEMFEKSDQTTSDISEILGGAIARFARFDDPSKALFEALKSENIKKGLKDFKIADVTKDMFNPDSKEFKDIDIYDFTHYLLMANREPNETNPSLKRLIEAVKDMQKENEKRIKKQKLETPSEWGHNYSEFKNDGLGAINKLLETKKGFVAGAFYKEGLGDIDLVWGNKDYGLEHILKRREEQAIAKKGLNETEAKEYALSVVKSIPEIIEKGSKGTDHLGRVFVDYGNKRVGLNNEWKKEKLENHWVISSYELYDTEKQALRSTPQAITKEKTFNSLNSVEPNSNTKKLNKE